MHLAAVQADGLHGAVGLQHDSPAGGLVHAPGLHAHEAGLHDVDAPDACTTPGSDLGLAMKLTSLLSYCSILGTSNRGQ